MVLQRTEMPFLFCNILYAVSYKHIKQLTKKKTVSDLLGPVTTTFPQYYFIGFEKKWYLSSVILSTLLCCMKSIFDNFQEIAYFDSLLIKRFGHVAFSPFPCLPLLFLPLPSFSSLFPSLPSLPFLPFIPPWFKSTLVSSFLHSCYQRHAGHIV